MEDEGDDYLDYTTTNNRRVTKTMERKNAARQTIRGSPPTKQANPSRKTSFTSPETRAATGTTKLTTATSTERMVTTTTSSSTTSSTKDANADAAAPSAVTSTKTTTTTNLKDQPSSPSSASAELTKTQTKAAPSQPTLGHTLPPPVKRNIGSGDSVENLVPKLEVGSAEGVNLTKDAPSSANLSEREPSDRSEKVLPLEADVPAKPSESKTKDDPLVREDGASQARDFKDIFTKTTVAPTSSKTGEPPTVSQLDANETQKENVTKPGRFTEFLRGFRSFHDHSADKILGVWHSLRGLVVSVLGLVGLGQVSFVYVLTLQM